MHSKWPKLLPVSDEMKEWAALVEGELLGWPGVKSRPMFGMIGFYVGAHIFAAVPRTRALGTSRSVIFKFARLSGALLKRLKKDPRVDAEKEEPGQGWYSFEIRSPEEIRDALRWLGEAYERARR